MTANNKKDNLLSLCVNQEQDPIVRRNGMEFIHRRNLAKILCLVIFSLAIYSFFEIENTQTAYGVGYTFTSALNMSKTQASTIPQILVNGSNVFVVWKEGTTGHIFYENSTDGGATFNGGTPGTAVDLSGSISGSANTPTLAISGSHVYVTWQQGSPQLIYFTNSTDSGKTFNGGTTHTPGTPTAFGLTGTSLNTQIATSGSNVYVVWQNTTSTDIHYEKSTDSGKTFNGGTTHTPGSPIDLSNVSGSSSSAPQIAAVGTSVFVTWIEGTPNNDVYFTNSTDSGTTFNGGTSTVPGTPTKLGKNATPSSVTIAQPRIVAGPTSVVVVYRNSTNSHVFATNSTDGGQTFNGGTTHTPGTPVDLSSTLDSTAQSSLGIAMSGSNVYVTWSKGTTTEIYFTNSTDSGKTFNGGTTHTAGTPSNLSNDAGASDLPTIAASGSNVYVVWRDKTSPDTTGDVYFSVSNNNGASFNGANTHTAGAAVDISNTNSILSNNPVVGASSSTVYVSWQETNAAGTGTSTYFSRGIPSSKTVAFDSLQYTTSGTATVTVTDSSSMGAGTITATVKSTSDATGISITLTETPASSGIFSGHLTFTTGTSSGSVLRVSKGDTITASFGGQSGTASIYTPTISTQFTSYTFSSNVIITVNDQNANTNPSAIETVSARVATTASSSGTSITLTETGANTGVFKNKVLIFTDGNAQFSDGNSITVSITDNTLNTDTTTKQTVNAQVTTLFPTLSTDSTINPIVLTESDVNTGIFQAHLTLTTGSTTSSAIHITGADILQVTSAISSLSQNALILPTQSGVDSIPATASADTLTASYTGATSATATIGPGSAGGGGGGGLVRPGLVLDIVAGIVGGSANVSPSFDLSRMATAPGALPDNIRQEVLTQDPFKPIPPSHDTSFDFPLSIGDNGYPLAHYTNTISPNTVKAGDPVSVKLNIPATGLEHLALYTNIRGTDRDIYHSDTYIIYDKGQPLQIVDPHGYFAHVDFDLSTSGVNNKISYKITFAKPMDKSDIDLRAWNDHKATSDTKILDAWQVEPQSQTSQSQTTPLVTEPIENVKPDQTVPVTPQVTTQNENSADIMPAIKDWGGYSPHPISDSELLQNIGIKGDHIPSWFIKISKWVVDGEMSQQEFIDAVKYMNDKGMIK